MAKLTSWLRVSAVAGALLFAAPTFAAADPAGAPARPVPAVAPGVGLGIYDAAGNPGGGCTAGFLAHGAAGQPVMISAGHCDHGGEVDIKWSKTGAYEKVGAFSDTVHEGSSGETSDIGLIRLEPGVIPSDLRVIGIRPVTGVTSDVKKGDQLCHFGDVTGLQCGPVTEVTKSKVTFAAKVAVGDSGGPVYVRNPDGTATAVGVVIRGPADGSQLTAELVKPWLETWQLTLDTPRPGPQVNPIGYR